MLTLATSVFLQVLFATLIVVPVVILWIAAVFDLFRHQASGLKIAATLVLILLFPILGPILYFIFGRAAMSAEDAHLAQADMRREVNRRPIGGTGLHR